MGGNWRSDGVQHIQLPLVEWCSLRSWSGNREVATCCGECSVTYVMVRFDFGHTPGGCCKKEAIGSLRGKERDWRQVHTQ